jgi:hypothetical protein
MVNDTSRTSSLADTSGFIFWFAIVAVETEAEGNEAAIHVRQPIVRVSTLLYSRCTIPRIGCSRKDNKWLR